MSIKINVGGTIFETTVNTIKKINYFKYMLEATDFDFNTILFVDRSPHIFKHVLSLVRDLNYQYPLKYKSELDFYDMAYDINKLYDVNDNMKILNEHINIMAEIKGFMFDDIDNKYRGDCFISSCKTKRLQYSRYCRAHSMDYSYGDK